MSVDLRSALAVLLIFLFFAACEQPPLQYRAIQNHLHLRAVPAEPFDQAQYDAANLAWGGRLYDEWWSNLDGTLQALPPETDATHVLWPAENTAKTGVTTWRCKSCHGWDYRGRDGVYGQAGSSYLTGIKGIIPIDVISIPTYTTPEEIYNFLHDGLVNDVSHGFGSVILDDMAVYALTKFVVTMQEEAQAARAPNNFIDDATRLTTGDEANGVAIYTAALTEGGCETCHGADGKLLDFADGDPATMPNQFVDSYARANPWETLHKIRFGQPGSEPLFMQGLEDYANFAGLDIIQSAVDVVAYAQNGLVPSTTDFSFRMFQAGMDAATADQASLDFARGGILYDKWWTAADETAPLVVPPEIIGVDHPLWTPAASNLTPSTGDVTWRCKSCHGWDYVGADGAYGAVGGSYETGIKGIVVSNGLHPTHLEPVAIYDFLHSGTVAAEGDHAFNTLVSPMDLYALTRFVYEIQQEAMKAMAPGDFIDLASGTVTAGNYDTGLTQYHASVDAGGCGDVCHGVDGQLIDFADGDPLVEPNIFLGDYAVGNPWETLHKIRFGNPGSIMPGLSDYHDPATLGMMKAVDILNFITNGIVPPPDLVPVAGYRSSYYR